MSLLWKTWRTGISGSLAKFKLPCFIYTDKLLLQLQQLTYK
jgi:hypothetical protein